MKTLKFLMLILFVSLTSYAQDIPLETQISNALLAAPEESRAGATVMGYVDEIDVKVIREGSNDLICITDNPYQDGVDIACYHKDLEPFMARGRELRKQGMGRVEIFNKREEEVKSGELFMPKTPTTLHILYGPKETINTETGVVEGAKMRWVIYIPFATGESTGLPLSPSGPGYPWLMDPGTHRAHIMVTPK